MKKNKVAVYEDDAAKLDRKAVEADLRLICRDEKQIIKSRDNIKSEMVEILNAAIRQGLALQRICKHEQVSFSFIEKVRDKLPWGDDLKSVFETAKKRVAFAHGIGKEIKSLDDLQPEGKKQLLLLLGIAPQQNRDGEGEAPQHDDPFTGAISSLLSFKQDFLKVLKLKPLEERTKPQLRHFIEDTEWLVEMRKQAERLLEAD
jgi:hypothetical protein